MFVVEFINTAVVILVVNCKLDLYIFNIPIIAGQYSEFSVDWYRMVGSTIILTTILRLVTPHIFTALKILCIALSRCYDRKWTFNKSRTR